MNKRIVIVLSEPHGALESNWDQIKTDLAQLNLSDVTRSTQPGPVIVTCNIDAGADIGAVLKTLNDMSEIRNAEEDSWSFNQ
ncbi:MAG: hypothetical protein WBC93_10555 [Sulfitobacter sp.]